MKIDQSLSLNGWDRSIEDEVIVLTNGEVIGVGKDR